jgi:CheY-like chemotaxis protein
MVRANSDHLLELINDVLDYAKAESGKIIATPAEILLGDLLTDVCQIVRTQADAKGHKLIITPSDETIAFRCDRRHIRQMMINLLTNAIKYTPQGGTIVVWGERLAGNKVKISVKDSGVGIAPADRAKVFSAFERIEHSYSIQQTGTGLGMPLTRRLVVVNGGAIDFESETGKGSTFWVVLPAVQYDLFMKGVEKEVEPDARGHGEVVVLVEPDAHEREMGKRYLTHIGFVAVEALTTGEVIEQISRHRARLVVLGTASIGSDEESFISSIRHNTPHPIRILLVSSKVFNAEIEQYLKFGVDRCLLKPFSLKTFGHVCRELVDSVSSTSRLLRLGDGAAKDLPEQSKSVANKDDIVH